MSTPQLATITLTLIPGQTLAQAQGGDAVELGCQAGHCMICAVALLEGADALDQPTPQERYTLTRAELERGVRLACQALAIEAGTVKLVVY